jgi:predicted DNA-binding transcriptional regulator YafY
LAAGWPSWRINGHETAVWGRFRRIIIRRADRLFQIIQILRRERRPVTGAAMAAELETSLRTVYRDIADLIGQRVPIRGEAGMGYVLEGGFDLPPLMLTPDEIDVAVLGAQWVARRGDPSLAKAAQDLIAKIAVSLPQHLLPHIEVPSGGVPPRHGAPPDDYPFDLGEVRAQIRAGRKMALRYRDEQGQASDRVIWPVIIGYMDAARLLIGWCELRQDFRRFRIDRIAGADFLEERYPDRPAALMARWRKTLMPPP